MITVKEEADHAQKETEKAAREKDQLNRDILSLQNDIDKVKNDISKAENKLFSLKVYRKFIDKLKVNPKLTKRKYYVGTNMSFTNQEPEENEHSPYDEELLRRQSFFLTEMNKESRKHSEKEITKEEPEFHLF